MSNTANVTITRTVDKDHREVRTVIAFVDSERTDPVAGDVRYGVELVTKWRKARPGWSGQAIESDYHEVQVDGYGRAYGATPLRGNSAENPNPLGSTGAEVVIDRYSFATLEAFADAFEALVTSAAVLPQLERWAIRYRDRANEHARTSRP